MSGAAVHATAWVTDPYVFWRHPVARISVVTLLILLDICVYGADPINESHVEGNIPGVGRIYNFLFCLPSSAGKLLSRCGLIFLSCIAGLYMGRQWLHHRLLRDICALSMFAGGNGSFIMMGLGVAGACLAGGAAYNWLVPSGVTGETDMEARTVGKILQILSAVAHTVAAVQVADGVMQDRQRYPNWASSLKRHWRRSFGGWLRILCAWCLAAAFAGVFVWSVFNVAATWGNLNEVARVFFSGLLVFFDLFAVVQDWEFPTLQAPPDLDLPILIAGSFRPSFRCGAGSCLLRCKQRLESGTSPSSRISLSGADKFLDVTIAGPWVTYGPLFCALCFDLLGIYLHMFYTPEDFGQYVDPSTNRIWSIVDERYLLAVYDSGILRNNSSQLVTWAARHNVATGLAFNGSAASDVLATTSYSGAELSGKILAAIPGLFMLLAFIPLVLVGERIARPPLVQVAPSPEPEVAAPKLRMCKWVSRNASRPLPPGQPPMDCPNIGMDSPRAGPAAESCQDDDLELTIPPPLVTPEASTGQGMVMAPNGKLVPRRGPRRTVPADVQASEKRQPVRPTPCATCASGNLCSLCNLADVQPVPDEQEPLKAQPAAEPSLDSPLKDAAEPEPEASTPTGTDVGASCKDSPLRNCADAKLDTMSSSSSGCRQAAVNRMSSEELHVKAMARQKVIKRSNEVGHFDVLLRKQGKPLGLTFRIPELVIGAARPTNVQQALLNGLELTVPDGAELLNFGRYQGMPMRDVAENFPRFCESALQEEADAGDPSPDLMRFAMYLRMAHSEFRDVALETAEELATHNAKEAETLLVADIAERSAVDDYNRAQAAAGTWDRVVLPGMHISAVNGIRRDPLAMANALCKSEVSTVRFLFLRYSDALDGNQKLEPLQVNDKMQRLLEERVSKLVRMEGEEIVNSMRSQAEWEAMASSLACALVKEVYKGDRLLQLPPVSGGQLAPRVTLPPGVPQPPEALTNGLSHLTAVSLPSGLPPALSLLPPPSAPVNTSLERFGSAQEMNDLSDSEESV